MNKFGKLEKRIKELKEEKEGWKSKYGYLLEGLKKNVENNSEKIDKLMDLMKELMKKEGKNDKMFSELKMSVKALNKSLTNLKNRQPVFREGILSRVESVEKRMDSTDRKLSVIEDEIREKIKDFGKAFDKQKDDLDELEKKLVIEMSQISMERENLFKDFNKIISDFKEMEAELEKLREKDSELDGRIRDMENVKDSFYERLETFKKDLMKMIEKVKGEVERKEREKKKEFKEMMDEFLIVKSQVDEKIKILSSHAKKFDKLKEDLELEVREDISKEIEEGLLKIEGKIEKSMNDLEQARIDVVKSGEVLKGEVDEKIEALDKKHRYFEEAVIEKLKDANDNILEHLRESEERTNKSLVENVEEMKKFREHITNFINDLIDNYEKRFEVLKNGMDELSKNVQSYRKGVSALVFE